MSSHYRRNPVFLAARLLSAVIIALGLVPPVGVGAPAAYAANLSVNLSADPGDGACDASCTLRDAILAAAALPGPDTITFSPTVTATIVLGSALPNITETLTIDGSGQAIRVDGANLFRVFRATAPLTLTALTVQRGRANDFFGGGGAYFGSAGMLLSVSFLTNTVIGAQGGGAFFATTGAISGSSFISNTASGGGGGGAYFSAAGVITSTVFQRNATNQYGGGVYVVGNGVISGSTFISNTATADGGGAYVFGATDVTGSTFTQNAVAGLFNSSGGGLYGVGMATLANSTFMSNTAFFQGGGARLVEEVHVNGGSFTGNEAGGPGGGLFGQYGGGVTNTTFLSNTAVQEGGGLYFDSFVALHAGAGGGGDIAPITGATFTGNTSQAGGGGGAATTRPTTVSNTTFTRNTANTNGGGLLIGAGGVVISVTRFFTNYASLGSGGGAYATGPVTVTGGTFSGNEAGASGGGARFGGDAAVSITGFFSNTADLDGGGLYHDGESIVMSTVTFGNNLALGGFSGKGGGAALGDTAVLTDVTITGNRVANGNGGGIYGSAVTVTLGIFEDNEAECEDELAGRQVTSGPNCGKGGGLYGVLLSALETTWQANKARQGGAIYRYAGEFSGFRLAAAVAYANEAEDEGGAIYVIGSTAEIVASIFGQNLAGTDGGAIYLTQSALNVDNSIFAENSATAGAGAEDIGTSYSHSTVTMRHVTHYSSPALAGFSMSAAVSKDPDEDPPAVSLTNVIFHGYETAVVGKAPTSTVYINAILLSDTDAAFQQAVAEIYLQYSGSADFVDAGNSDYRLGAQSAALDRGVDTGLATDIDGASRNQGSAPDLGAHESGYEIPEFQIYMPAVGIEF